MLVARRRSRGLRSHRADDQPLLRERAARPQLRRAAAPPVRVVHARQHRRRPVRRRRRPRLGAPPRPRSTTRSGSSTTSSTPIATRSPRSSARPRRPARSASGSWAGPMRSPRSASPTTPTPRSRSPIGSRRSSKTSRSQPRPRSPSGAGHSRPGRARGGSAPGTGPCATRPRPRSRRPARSASSPAARAASSRSTRSPIAATCSTAPSSPRSTRAFQRIAAERGFASPALFAAVAEHGGVRGQRRRSRRRPAAVPDRARDRRRAPTSGCRPPFSATSTPRSARRSTCRRDATAGRRQSCVPARVRAGLQGNHRVPGRQPRGPGARHRCARASPRWRRRAARSAARCWSSRVGCRLCRHCGWSVCG